MTSKNPAPTATNPVTDRRVQPDGPLSGEVQRGGATPAVYFIEATGFGRVKIGSAKDPEKRLKELQTGSPAILRIAATIQTSDPRRLEARLHRAFRDARVVGEWFYATRSLTRVIEAAAVIPSVVDYRSMTDGVPRVLMSFVDPTLDTDLFSDGCCHLMEAVGYEIEWLPGHPR